MTFQSVSGVTPDPKDPPSGRYVIALPPGLTNNNSRILETVSRNLDTETGSFETESRVHGIHDTLEDGLSRMPPRQAVDSLKRGRRILYCFGRL